MAKLTKTKSSAKTEPSIRWLIRRDLPEVLNIDGSYKTPWTEDEFIAALRNRNVIGVVIEAKDEILGYMLYELHKRTLRILKFAIHPDRVRERLGTALFQRMFDKLHQQRRTSIEVSVPETSLDTLLFLQNLNFVAVGLNDEVVMRYTLDHNLTYWGSLCEPDVVVEKDNWEDDEDEEYI